MAAKNKKELLKENSEIKKELSDVKSHYANLLEEYRCLEAKTISKCNKCEKNLEGLENVRNPKEDDNSALQLFKCDQCEKEFNQNWKLNAHLKTCRMSKCDVCDKTFKYEELRKKHMLITHENFKIYCHFFNNEKTCPYNEDCVYLHEDSTVCRYGMACERNYCMFKHSGKIGPVQSMFDKLVDKHDKADVSIGDKKKEDSNNDVTLVNESESIEEYDRVVIVDVEIMHEQSIASIGDKLKQTSRCEDVNDKMDANIAGGKVFVCKMCDYKAGKKFDMTTHLEDVHSWCYLCFSTFNNKEDLKNHIKNHKEQ